MSPEQQQLEAGIAALEAQRTLLDDAVVDASVAGLRAKLAALATTTAQTEPVQTLRQVSILFLDVVDSTSLAQRLDPEAVSAVMDDALARGTFIVEALRGKVLKYAGDNILAAFGAEEAREDDAERAVQAGLALLDPGRTLGKEVQAADGHAGFDVRVGIHSGGVLLGGGVDAEGSIRGSAVTGTGRKLLRNVQAAFAEHYLDELRDKTRRGLDRQFARGYHAGGIAYGYRSTPAALNERGEALGFRT